MAVSAFLVSALLTYSAIVSAQDASVHDFLVFGGSIKWHNSDASVKDFVSQLKVHVYSIPDETLRQVVPVLPNGAYSVVVTSKGRYRLRLSAPQGWNFLPIGGHEIDLNVDDQRNRMNYVFELAGFDVSGQVVTTGMTTGPPDLIVSIFSGNTVLVQTKTAADGAFTLSSVPPGNYVVVVGDHVSAGGLNDARASASITVSTSSLKIATPLVLQGHSLRSKVTFNGKGIANIPVLLLVPSSSELTVTDLEKFGCSKPSKLPDHVVPADLEGKVNPKVACQVVSSADGSFAFSRLAGGQYFLVAYHDSSLGIQSKHLTISPSFLSVNMEHVDRQLDPGFVVDSFRVVGGGVKHASGTPIPNAEVLVGGTSVTKTDSSGAFQLDVSAPSDYTLQISTPRMKFNPVKVPLTLATVTLPTFIPKEVEVCGRFLMPSGLKPNARLPTVEVTTGPSVEAAISKDGKSATFCFFLSPGKHVLRLAKSSTSVKFTPATLNVDLSSGPVKDLVFTQFQASAVGEVLCAHKCPVSQLAVRLSSKDALEPPLLAHVKAVEQDAGRATFSFTSLLPGTYSLELVVSDEMRPASGWCWASPGLRRRFTIIDRDLHQSPELVFRQTGYRLHVEAPLLDTGFGKSIEFKVMSSGTTNVTLATSKASFYQLTKPLSTICLPADSQSLVFEATAPCLHLGAPSPRSIQSAASEITIAGAPTTISIPVREVPVQAIVERFGGFTGGIRLPQLLVQARISDAVTNLSATWQTEGDLHVARAGLWAAPGDEVVFSVASTESSSDGDAAIHPLILPPTFTLRVPLALQRLDQSTYQSAESSASPTSSKPDETNCDAALAAAFGGSEHLTARFSMKPGFTFTGKVDPPVDKVLVNVYADASIVSAPPPNNAIDVATFTEAQLNAPPPSPGLTLVSRGLTDPQGVFRIGPFYFNPQPTGATPGSLLTLHLHKLGFEFHPKASGDWLTFSSQKLALVEIRAVSEDGLQPLPGTLISIIGSTLRDSKTTDASGFVQYIGLPPGEYYIQPTLKEYEFFVRKSGGTELGALMEHALSVVDGGSLSVGLIGRRIAYSLFGKVTSLSGHPEPDVVIEAKLLSVEAANALGSRPTFPSQYSNSSTACRGHSKDSSVVIPVEQATTGANGQFKLLGLLPGCPYSVTATRRDDAIGQRVSQSVPSAAIVKTSREDVHGLHFYLKPRVLMGMITATVDTTDEYLPSLSVVVYPVNQPNRHVIRHSFATDSRFFMLTGKQIEQLVGDTYTIALETNLGHDTRHRATNEKFTFKVTEESSGAHQHFNFAFRPHPEFTSAVTRV
ncbi:unnamed protein product [Mesocestoides corti]|uniref:Nodal modulator 1 n=2 Tax=Mesocestoides corti TaxID=53468 RepID=A0A0R3UHP8_MESCO|nr:unnamed protein product [Mesocestoides corti]